jgi:hypothetical protein
VYRDILYSNAFLHVYQQFTKYSSGGSSSSGGGGGGGGGFSGICSFLFVCSLAYVALASSVISMFHNICS